MGRSAIILALAFVLAPFDFARAQQPPVGARNTPPYLSAPPQVGRYTRGQLRDYGTPELGVAYAYSAGDSTRLTVYLYQRDDSTRHVPPSEALRNEIDTFKQALEIERARGVYEDYSIAFEGPDSISVDGRAIPGYQLGYVFRRSAKYVSFLFLYAIGDAFVKVRGTVPETDWERTDIPRFAHEVTIRASAPR